MFKTPSKLGRTTIDNLTPAQSQYILSNFNNKNRPIKKSKVDKYAEDMLNGKWDDDFPEGNTFTFDEEGEVLSAQHRYIAAVRVGYVFKNPTIDVVSREFWKGHSAEKRTAGDRAHMDLNRRFPNRVISSISKISGQYPFLKMPVPFVQTGSIKRGDENRGIVADKIGNQLTDLLITAKENRKTIKAAQLTALGCFLFSEIINLDKAKVLVLENKVTSPNNSLVCWAEAYKIEISGLKDKVVDSSLETTTLRF